MIFEENWKSNFFVQVRAYEIFHLSVRYVVDYCELMAPFSAVDSNCLCLATVTKKMKNKCKYY